jgi:selenocysteine lyase/cysteine desulfurase
VACRTLGRHWDAIVAHEEELLDRLRAGLAGLPGVRQLSIFSDDAPRVGVVSFTVEGHDPGLVAAYLSAEHGIGVRDGAFCAHIAVQRLTGGRALRASLGLGSTAEHVDRLVTALRQLLIRGPEARYELVDGRFAPVDDPRPLPPFLTARGQ